MKRSLKTVASKYNRSTFPDWLNTLSDEHLDKYFADHPTSKYNPFTDGQGDDEDNDSGSSARDDDWTEHKRPLALRLTFTGWSKSAPTKEVRDSRNKYIESQEDLDLDRLDIMDIIKDLQDEQKDDKESRSDTSSPRRKKRLTVKIDRRAKKISKLKARISKLSEKSAKLKKRIRLLDKELKKRG